MPVLLPTTSTSATSPPRFRRLHYEMKEIKATRDKAQHFLGTKFHHYLLLTLITVDVATIFAHIFISLYSCEEGRDISEHRKKHLERAREALEYVSLAFSSLFVLGLLVTIWAYGKKYFKSKFHLFDGSVIIASFVIDVVLRGVNQEVASLVIILRLWRFVKIIEEVSGAEEDKVEELQERVKEMETENREIKDELKRLRMREV